jgi:hypothetical protein
MRGSLDLVDYLFRFAPAMLLRGLWSPTWKVHLLRHIYRIRENMSRQTRPR